MAVLSYNELKNIVANGVIRNCPEHLINAASIDVTLGTHIMVEKPRIVNDNRIVSLRDRQALQMDIVAISREGYVLVPGQFILAHSQQLFYLPNNICCEYKLKSSMARIGLEHLTAGWCDPGWNGSALTLELKNMTQHHAIRLNVGDRIGQIVFFSTRPVPKEKSYAASGRYNGDRTVTGVKP